MSIAPTRVLLFRPTLADGGADRVTLTLLESLDRQKFAVTLVLVKRAGALLRAVPADIEIVDLHATRLALAAWPLARVIRQRKPDVVMCTAGGANVVCAAAHGLARSRARLVLSERSALHRADRNALRTLPELMLKRAMYRRADLVTAVSDGVAADLQRELGLPASHIATVYNPVVTDDFAALMAAPVDHPWFSDAERARVPVLVACGRLVAIKDYATMLHAFAALRSSMPNQPLRLAILGEGPERSALTAQAAALGLADDVAFLGFDPNPLRFMAKAALVLQSSRAEGLPGVLIQGGACGVAVVATDCDHGPREVIAHGETGLLVPVGDAQALADSARALLLDADRRHQLGAAAALRMARYHAAASLARYQAALLGTPMPVVGAAE